MRMQQWDRDSFWGLSPFIIWKQENYNNLNLIEKLLKDLQELRMKKDNTIYKRGWKDVIIYYI